MAAGSNVPEQDRARCAGGVPNATARSMSKKSKPTDLGPETPPLISPATRSGGPLATPIRPRTSGPPPGHRPRVSARNSASDAGSRAPGRAAATAR